CSQQRRQMTARGCAAYPDVLWVEIVFFAVGAKPADCRLAVLDLSREDRLLAESILDTGRGVALSDKEAAVAPSLAPRLPSAAMDPDYKRQRLLTCLFR